MKPAGGGSRPPHELRVGVAVPAAGSGARMGGARKPFLELAGEPLLLHALRPFLAEPRVVAVVVALAPPDADAPPPWLVGLDPRVRVVAGGATRTESVRRALAGLSAELDVIAVHDAARPLVTPEVVSACIALAASGVGAVAGCPAVDTVKRVDAEGVVIGTPDRAALWQAQTPQVFPAGALRDAYAVEAAEGTDDAALVERARPGFPIRMVDAGPANLKVTRPEDVPVAEALLALRARR
ncbi:MAG TPA: 2-C-methyl-D-erythritol 4-phosphate cytidylyltransferase [Longimicrobiales bacterium]|nr:2-C-methyl-D-erythritol 4-phosphate cytidylyltransferase [Longimicrobiales bacterium]